MRVATGARTAGVPRLPMAPSLPSSYELALEQRPRHLAAYHALGRRVEGEGDGAAARLRTFEALIARARPAINMTLLGCIRFLESGRWLNVWEKVAIDLGTSRGPAYEAAVGSEMGGWLRPRATLERLLRFQRDTHYAALNLGGTGPSYGDWCVRFDHSGVLRFATSFAGDPLRWVFDEDGNQVLSDDDVLTRFACHDERVALAARHNEHLLLGNLLVDEDLMRTLLEDRETLIEVHIHGEVLAEHAVEIGVRKGVYDRLARLALDEEAAEPRARAAKRFRHAALFRRLLRLVDDHPKLIVKQERG